MQPENLNQEVEQTNQETETSPLHQVTPFSKYLAMALFIILPFLGGWIGYQYAPEKVAEVDKVVYVEEMSGVFDSTPFTKTDKQFSTDDIFWEVEMVLDGTTLFWKHDYSDDWESFAVENPDSLRYVGFGVLTDSSSVYTVGYLQGIEVLNPTADFIVISKEGQDFILNDDKTYVLVSEMSLPVLLEVEDVNFESLEVIGGGYFKDSESVFFASGNVWKLDAANPSSFSIETPVGEIDWFFVGVSGSSVYFHEQFLKGIDYQTMSFESGYAIIRDEDTIWFAEGNCRLLDYREGDFNEVELYEPPC